MTRTSFFLAVAVLAVTLFSVQGTQAIRLPLWRRDEPTTAALNTLPMSIRFDSHGRYILPVRMSSSQPQDFNFTLSTSTGLTYVAGTACTDCENTTLYNQTGSSSAAPIAGLNDTTSFGSESINGPLIKEDCSARLSNGSFWAYPNQTVVNVDSQSSTSNPIFANGISGIFGLGHNRGSAVSPGIGFSDSIYGQWLTRNPTQRNFTFGMALQPPTPKAQSGDEAGALHWLKPDPSYYHVDQTSYTPVQMPDNSPQMQDNASVVAVEHDWTVALDGWQFVTGSTHLSNTESVVASVDPLYPNIYLPANEARVIHAAIPGSQEAPARFTTIEGASQAYEIPCDARFTFALVVGTQSFVVSQDMLLIPQFDGTCISGIEGFTDTTRGTYLIGARFIGTVYLIFSVPRDGTPTIGWSPRTTPSSSSKTKVGPIVGGTIGGVALLLIIALVVFYFIRKRTSHSSSGYDPHPLDKPTSPMSIEPFTATTPTTVARASVTEPATPVTGTYTTTTFPGSPMQTQPLLAAQHDWTAAVPLSQSDASDLGVASPPPAYEAEAPRTPASGSAGGGARQSVRDSKSRPSPS